MVDAFLAIAPEFLAISQRYADTDADHAREAALLAANGYPATTPQA